MTDGQYVGSQIDSILDDAQRRRARTAALTAIDEVLAANPSQPDAGEKRHRARRSS